MSFENRDFELGEDGSAEGWTMTTSNTLFAYANYAVNAPGGNALLVEPGSRLLAEDGVVLKWRE